MRHPPRLARRLLALTLPNDVRDAILGDLQEVHARKVAEGARAPNLWFWFQTAWFSLRFTAERLRDAVTANPIEHSISVLDFKLGARMLARSPLLSVSGCLAIATAIGVYASFTQFFGMAMDPGVELPERHRLVTLTQRDTDSGRLHSQLLYDLGRWQASLETVESLGALRPYQVNVIGPDGRVAPIDGVELSVSALELAGLVPQMGRPLLPEDEIEGADRVVVLSQELWQSLLGGDPQAIGTTIRLGPEAYTVVGVAQPGFQFPIGRYFWTPMRMKPTDFGPLSGPGIVTIGRLAPSRSIKEVRTELAHVQTLVAAEEAATHALLRPVVAPFHHRFRAGGIDGVPPLFLTLIQILFGGVMLVACANVATLVFARNAARSTEIAVRTALGASRGRIVSQLFAEAIVLASIAAGLGLTVASIGFGAAMDVFWLVQRQPPPPWYQPGLTPNVVGRSLALAMLGAGIIGVLPALRATSRRFGRTLQESSTGGGGMRFGALPTAIIIAQTALSVAILPMMVAQVVLEARKHETATEVETERFISARVRLDGALLEELGRDGVETEVGLRYAQMRDALKERLERERDIGTASFATRLPGIAGTSNPHVELEIDGVETPPNGQFTKSGLIDGNYLTAIGARVAEGRPFRPSDHGPEASVAIVNRSFADRHLGGTNAVGRLVRETSLDGNREAPWIEIVGVVENRTIGPDQSTPVILFPAGHLLPHPTRVLARVDADPSEFGSRLRALSAEVAPGLILDELYSLEELRWGEVMYERSFLLLLAFVAAITLLLSTTGIYALMSFIVAQRTREIGIRTALGASSGRIVTGIFGRALRQLGLGATIGAVMCGSLSASLIPASTAPQDRGDAWITLLVVTILLVAVGLLGCIVPVRRGLSVEPTEALRSEG